GPPRSPPCAGLICASSSPHPADRARRDVGLTPRGSAAYSACGPLWANTPRRSLLWPPVRGPFLFWGRRGPAMDRCAMFVDAGYLLAAGGALCCASRRRAEVVCNYPELVRALIGHARGHCGLELLRVYWYDGAPDAVPLADHLAIGELPNVKLRLGRLSGNKQKGVDSLIMRDVMTLARERAVATAYLLGGDEDLREGVVAAQDMGMRVVV